MWEVERVAISMSNNAEEAIHQRVRDGAISQADATKFLASDTVQLHAKRWRRVTRQSKPLSEMTVEEALLDVEEMSNSRIWPDPCTLSMRCSLFSRWRPDKSSSFAATANGDVCVSVVDCPPAAERSDNAMNRVPAAEGDSEEYFLIDTHDFALDIQQDVEGRVIQTLKDKQQEALVINGTQTMGAWIHANETTVQFNLTSLMVCVPQADLMRWKQPRQTLQSVVAQRQAQYKEAVRAHLLAGGMLRPRRSLNGEKVVEAVFQLDNGLELCADFKRPGVFDETLPQRSTWSTLEDVPSTLKGLPKTAKVFKAPAHTPQSASRGRPLARKCSCPRCVAQQSSSQEAQEPTESSAAESPEAEAGASDATAKEDTPQNSKDTPPTKAKSSKRAAKQAQNTQQVQSTPDSAAPASPVAAADSAAHSAALPPAAEVSPLAAAFGSSLEDAVHRAGRSKGASGGLRMSSAYAASLGLDIDAGDSVRIGEERGGGAASSAPPWVASSPAGSTLQGLCQQHIRRCLRQHAFCGALLSHALRWALVGRPCGKPVRALRAGTGPPDGQHGRTGHQHGPVQQRQCAGGQRLQWLWARVASF